MNLINSTFQVISHGNRCLLYKLKRDITPILPSNENGDLEGRIFRSISHTNNGFIVFFAIHLPFLFGK